MKKGPQDLGKQGIVMHACSLTRCGLRHLLATHLPDFTFLEASSFSEMERLPTLAKAELIVSDLGDDERNSTYAAEWLLALQNLRGDKPSIVITEDLPKHQLALLSSHPALSVIALQTPEALLNQQLHQILSGKRIISSLLYSLPIVSATSVEPCQLTEAELTVFGLLHAGYSVTQIASRLCRSVKTVSTHKRHMMNKLQVESEIALFARVTSLNEKTGALDNGQHFIRHLRWNAC